MYELYLARWKKTSHLTPQEQFGDISTGAQVCISLKQFCTDAVEGRTCRSQRRSNFVDRQMSGPFSFGSIIIDVYRLMITILLEDEVHYKMPLHPLGNIGLPFMRRKIWNPCLHTDMR